MNTLTKLFSNESITLISVIAIILLAALSVFIFIKRPNKLGKTVLWFMIPVFVIGILLHYMGLDFCDGETPWHYKLLSSIISGFRMFGFYLSSSAVEDLVVDNNLYAVAITILYVVASMNSIYIFIIVIYSNFKNEIKALLFKNKEHYIILGNSKDSFNLANDISKIGGKIIVLLDKTKENKELITKYNDRNIAFLLSKNKKKLLKKAGILKAHCTIVSLESDEELNLQNAIAISELINNNSKAYISFDDISHNHYLSVCKNKNIKFFNKHKLISSLFVFENRLFKLMGIDKIDVKLNTPKVDIKHVFLGFNETSENILVDLILNYQLIDKDFNSLIYVGNAKEKEERFYSSYYAYKDIEQIILDESKKETKEYLDLENIKMNLTFNDDDFETYSFRREILSKINDQVFIYIDYDNDRINFDRAIDLNEFLKSHFRRNYYIFVRLKEPNLFDLDKILPENIITYGEESHIISKRIIIDEKLDVLAKQINHYYDVQRVKSGKGELLSADESWNNLTYLQKESNRCAATSLIIKLNLMGLDLGAKNIDEAISEEEFLKIYKGSEISLFGLDSYDYNSPRTNLAILEHIRWNTFQIMNNTYPMKIDYIFYENKYNRVDKEHHLHSNITSFKGMLQLEQLIINAEFLENEVKKAESGIFVKDFEGMDNIFDIIKDSDFIICKIMK